jgi:hypothetical protein
MGVGGRITPDNFEHDVSLRGSAIVVDTYQKRVRLHPDKVRIGCTTVSREVIEKLAELFAKHYPKEKAEFVDIQY